MQTPERPGLSLFTFMTQAAAEPSDFQWPDAYPSIIGAGIGALAAIIVGVLTQAWLAWRAAREHKTERLEDALQGLLEAAAEELDGEPGTLVKVIGHGYVTRAWAMRAKYPQFAAAQERCLQQAVSADTPWKTAVWLTTLTLVCSEWLVKPRAFERRWRPVSVDALWEKAERGTAKA